MKSVDTSPLTYEYILEMSKSKKYNPQTIANTNMLKRYGYDKIKRDLEMNVEDFCNTYFPKKARDFIYKSDYFTPRNMYLISPLYYAYYTNLVFRIVSLYLKDDSELNFSNEKMKIFYSGFLDLEATTKEIKVNAMFNKSYKAFQKEREGYFGRPVLKLDLQDFFNSIKIKTLLKKLRDILGEQEQIDDLQYFFNHCEFECLPQFHYSIASSILSQFYLLDFDSKMIKLLDRENLFLIRFVDDMFIVHLDGEMNHKKDNTLLNEINYFLWEDELNLNSSKTKLLSSEEYINTVQLTNEYDGDSEISFSSEKIVDEKTDDIINSGQLITLIEELCALEKSAGIDLKKYKELINTYISINGEDSRKVLNHIIFSRKWERISDDDLLKLIRNWEYIMFNPSQFTILYILVCRYLENKNKINGSKIKRILHYLFRSNNFTFRDTLIAVAYLFQNKNKNEELLSKIKNVNPTYVEFIESFI